MEPNINEFVQYRLAKADEVLEAAQILFDAKQWNSFYYIFLGFSDGFFASNLLHTFRHL